MLTFEHTLGGAPLDGTFVRRIMLERGFREVKSDRSRLRFQRGSAFAMMFAFSPAKWRADVSVDTERGHVQIDVHTKGQIVTKTERAYFEVLVSDLRGELSRDTARDDVSPSSEIAQTSRALEKSAIMINVRLAVATSIVSAFGTLSVIAFLFGNLTMSVVLMTVGVVLTVYVAAGRKPADHAPSK